MKGTPGPNRGGSLTSKPTLSSVSDIWPRRLFCSVTLCEVRTRASFPTETVVDTFRPDDQIVSLTRAPNAAQAHIWKNALRNKGIRCRVVGDYLDAGIGDISGVQPEIWVKIQDTSQAQTVLQQCSQSIVETFRDESSTDSE